MVSSASRANGKIRELTREEGRELFDRQARQVLHISGDEFIRAYNAGEFDDRLEDPEIVHLVMLLPFAA